MHCRWDDDKEADDLTDLLTAVLKLTVSPEGSNSLEVIKELLSVAENVCNLTDKNLEDLTSTDISNDVTDGLLKVSKTASFEGLADGLDGISKLLKSTFDGLDAQLLDTSLKIRPGSVHLSNDDVNVTGTSRRITHAGSHTLSNTADEAVDILRSSRDSDLLIVLIDEDAKDLTNIFTSSIEVLVLPFRGNILEEVDELTTVRKNVHDFVLDECHDLTFLDFSDDLDDRLSNLLETAVLETVGKLLNTISKSEKTLHDRLYTKVLDTISNKLNSVIEITSHIVDILDASSRITHNNIETISNTLEEVDHILLALDLAVLSKLGIRSNDKT